MDDLVKQRQELLKIFDNSKSSSIKKTQKIEVSFEQKP